MPDALVAVVLVSVAVAGILTTVIAVTLAVRIIRVRTAIIAVLLDDGPCPWPLLMERVGERCGHHVPRAPFNDQLRALEAAGVVRFEAPFYSARITSRAVATEAESA